MRNTRVSSHLPILLIASLTTSLENLSPSPLVALAFSCWCSCFVTIRSIISPVPLTRRILPVAGSITSLTCDCNWRYCPCVIGPLVCTVSDCCFVSFGDWKEEFLSPFIGSIMPLLFWTDGIISVLSSQSLSDDRLHSLSRWYFFFFLCFDFRRFFFSICDDDDDLLFLLLDLRCLRLRSLLCWLISSSLLCSCLRLLFEEEQSSYAIASFPASNVSTIDHYLSRETLERDIVEVSLHMVEHRVGTIHSTNNTRR